MTKMPKCREMGDLKGREYDYLGHFRKAEFQKLGHNVDKSRLLAALSSGFGGIAAAMGDLAPDTTTLPKIDTKKPAPMPTKTAELQKLETTSEGIYSGYSLVRGPEKKR